VELSSKTGMALGHGGVFGMEVRLDGPCCVAVRDAQTDSPCYSSLRSPKARTEEGSFGT